MPDEEVSLGIVIEALTKDLQALDQATQKIDALASTTSAATATNDEASAAFQALTAAATSSGTEHTKHTAAAKEAKTAEEDLTRGARESAKAFGELGAKGGELVERFTALTSLSAAGGPMGTALGALLVGVGAVAEGVKKVDETYQEQQHAEEDLKQAMDATAPVYTDKAQRLEEINRRFEEFANTNSAFIDNENTAKEALAGFIRAGFDTDQSMEALGISLDLAGAKNEDLATAGNQVLMMMEGQGRVAHQLGIDIAALKSDDESASKAHAEFTAATKEVTNAQLALETAQKRQRDAAENLKRTQDELAGKHKLTAVQADNLHIAEQRVADANDQAKTASEKLTTAQNNLRDAQGKVNNSVNLGTQVMDQARVKLDGGRQSVTQHQQAVNELNHSWDQFSQTTGPAVDGAINVMISTLQGLVELLNDTAIAGENAWNWAATAANAPPPGGGAPATRAAVGHRQGGGSMMPGGVYEVGETGPETVVMGASGGAWVIPSATGGGGAGADMTDTNELLAAILAEMRAGRGFTRQAYGRT